MAGRRRALIVANDVYEHEGLERLSAPAADADALAAVLGDAAIGGFEVDIVHNESAHAIQGRIEDLFAEARTDDVLLLHFSCHGLKGDSGELFFAAHNTRPNRLASSAVPAEFVQRCMRASRSRSIVLLLDCCYGGAFSQGVRVRAAGDVNVFDSFPGGRLGGGRGRAVITASSAMEYAFEGDRLADGKKGRPSVFTSALVEGLATGDADRDLDGWVSLNELYDYVFDKVRERNPHQTPGRDVEMQGELYLARNPRPAGERGTSGHAPPVVPAASTRRRWYFVAGAAALLALAAAGLAYLLASRSGPQVVALRQGTEFEAAAPWRLVVTQARADAGQACTFTLTDVGTGAVIRSPVDVYLGMSFQFHRSGTFRWDASRPGCEGRYHAGAGLVTLPFIPDLQGETDAFRPGGPVNVEVTETFGNPKIEIRLYDAADGRQLDVGTVSEVGGKVRLDPHGTREVYLRSWYCPIYVSAG